MASSYRPIIHRVVVSSAGHERRKIMAQECHSGRNMSEYHGRIELAESKESTSYDHWPLVASILLFDMNSDDVKGG